MVMYDDPAARFEECCERAQRLAREGKFADAIEALDEIPARYQHRTTLIGFRCEIHLQAKQWKNAAEIAERLVKVEPQDPGHWIHWAYAVRRLHSIAEAERILTIALSLHPGFSTIHYNLACYASQTGRLLEARERLAEAVRLDPGSRALAAQDADLAPLMAVLPEDDPLRAG